MSFFYNLNNFGDNGAYFPNFPNLPNAFHPCYMPNITINVFPQHPMSDPSQYTSLKSMPDLETWIKNMTDLSKSTNQSQEAKSDGILRKTIKKAKLNQESLLNSRSDQSKTGNRTKFSRPKDSRSKHVLKNYANAISTFAISPIAIPHLQPIFQREGIMNIELFTNFVMRHKEYLNNITRVRGMMMGEDEDSAEELALKNCFRSISEVFVKYFAVNWIYESKLQDKRKYLEYRFRLLRRIKNPYLFTTMS